MAQLLGRLRVSALVLVGIVIFERAGLLPNIVDGLSPAGDAASYHAEVSALTVAATASPVGTTETLRAPWLAMATLAWFLAVFYLRKSNGTVRDR